jgi:hypothetical protein
MSAAESSLVTQGLVAECADKTTIKCEAFSRPVAHLLNDAVADLDFLLVKPDVNALLRDELGQSTHDGLVLRCVADERTDVGRRQPTEAVNERSDCIPNGSFLESP